MARRIVLGRRGSSSSFGLWVSKAGFDANAAADANLLFSMSERFGMVLASGTVTVPSIGNSTRVAFGDTYPSVPLVFCGQLTQQPSDKPVNIAVDVSGFTVRPNVLADGTAPAAGMTARWFAVMTTQG